MEHTLIHDLKTDNALHKKFGALDFQSALLDRSEMVVYIPFKSVKLYSMHKVKFGKDGKLQIKNNRSN